MFLFVMIVALMFLIAGGIGLFYTFASVAAQSALWVFGLITFGTFTLFGIAVLVFLAIYNTEFE